MAKAKVKKGGVKQLSTGTKGGVKRGGVKKPGARVTKPKRTKARANERRARADGNARDQIQTYTKPAYVETKSPAKRKAQYNKTRAGGGASSGNPRNAQYHTVKNKGGRGQGRRGDRDSYGYDNRDNTPDYGTLRNLRNDIYL